MKYRPCETPNREHDGPELRRSLELSLRERLQAIDEMAKLAQALSQARAECRLRSPQ
jgi:hypothetical protein